MISKTELIKTFFILFCCFISIHGQSISTSSDSLKSNKEYKSNFGFCLNVGIGSNYFGPTVYTGITTRYKKNLFAVHYLKADEFRFSAGGYDFDEPALNMKEISILFGRFYKEKNLILSILAGIGFLNGTDRGQKITEKVYENINLSTLCFPFEAGCRIDITKRFGIGVLCIGNINSKRNYFGGVLAISIGNLNL